MPRKGRVARRSSVGGSSAGIGRRRSGATFNQYYRTIENKEESLYDVVVAKEDWDYDSLKAAIDAWATNIFVRDWTYNETAWIEVTADGTTIVGQSRYWVEIVWPSGVDVFVIKWANNCFIANMTIDGEINYAEATFVISDGQTAGNADHTKGNDNTLFNCTLKGNPTVPVGSGKFALYLAWPSHTAWSDTLDAYEAGELNSGNKIIDCEIVTGREWDGVSLSLQKNLQFINSTANGTRIAYYMCKDSIVNTYIVKNSSSVGVYISWPMNNCILSDGVIVDATQSGIKFENQAEHTPLNAGQSISGNQITDNVITRPWTMWLEFSGDASNVIEHNNIADNTIDTPGDHGVYLLHAQRNLFANNIILDPRENTDNARGSWFYVVAGVQDNTYIGNLVNDRRAVPQMHAWYADRENAGNTGNKLIGNSFLWLNNERTVWVFGDETVIEGNTIEGGKYAGILLEWVSKSIIKGNKIKDNCNHANNTFSEIHLKWSSTDNIIEGNTILATATNKAKNGIYFETSGDTDNQVGVNIIDGTVTNDIEDNGTENIYNATKNVAQEYTKTQNFNATTLTDWANISWDLSQNQVSSVTLWGNRTLDNPTNMVDGATYILIVKQDGTGSRTLAYGTAYKRTWGTAPTLSTGANAVDILSFVSDGTNMYGVSSLNFS